jgi:hypothetical protein
MKCNPVNSRLAGYSDLGQEEKATGLVEAPSMQDTDEEEIDPPSRRTQMRRASVQYSLLTPT